jgi:hypothetical protein
MFWIAFAAQITAPQPVHWERWWSTADMPRSILESGGSRNVATRTTVRPNGAVLRCEVERPSGDANLDRITCAIIAKRGKFVPARDTSGTPTYGVYRQTMTWAVIPVGEKADSVIVADLDLSVRNLPPGVKSPTIVRVMFGVDERGRPSACVPEPTIGKTEVNPQLALVACQQVIRSYVPAPVNDEKGLARASIQDAIVRFTAQIE